jgi:hypothetical protein
VCRSAERQREKEREYMDSRKIEKASVVKTAVRRTDHFGISQDKLRQIYFNYEEEF